MTTRSKYEFTVAPSGWSPPRGRVLQRTLRHDATTEYFYYVPNSASQGAPVLAAIHGTSRLAGEYARLMAPYCEAHGVVLLAPLFGDQHRDYQRLGREGRGRRADVTLHRCLAELGSLTGADVSHFFLFGYSAGAQFAHRYLMAHPHRVARAMVVASGWYTFPDFTQRYPYGIRPIRALPQVSFNPEEFLKVPVDVFVGEDDLDSVNLRSTKRVNEQQGRTRVERARRWVAAMRDLARLYQMAPRVRLKEVEGVGHSFRDFHENGELIERLFKALVGKRLANGNCPSPNGSNELKMVSAG